MLQTLSSADQKIMGSLISAGLQGPLTDMVDALGPNRVDTEGLKLLQATEARIVFKLFYPKAAAWLKANLELKPESRPESSSFQTEFSEFMDMHCMLDAIHEVRLFDLFTPAGMQLDNIQRRFVAI